MVSDRPVRADRRLDWVAFLSPALHLVAQKKQLD